MGPGRLGPQAVGIVAGGHEEGGCGVDADTIDIQQFGSVGLEEGGDPGIELGDLLVGSPMRWASEESDAFVATVTGSVDRVGRSPLAAAMNCGAGRPLMRLELVGSGKRQLAHLGEGLHSRLTG